MEKEKEKKEKEIEKKDGNEGGNGKTILRRSDDTIVYGGHLLIWDENKILIINEDLSKFIRMDFM